MGAVLRSALALTALAATVSTVTAALIPPLSGAGATATAAAPSGACVAWGSLPARVALGPAPVTVVSTLRGTPTCTGITADAGAQATLRDPAGNYPMVWSHLGGQDSASLLVPDNRPGTYRLESGRLQTYDAAYERIPATWRVTETVVKYAGRVVGVQRGAGRVFATVQAYGPAGWQGVGGVPVTAQQLRSGHWTTVASARTSASGGVRLGLPGRGQYRLVSADTGRAWGATAVLGATQV